MCLEFGAALIRSLDVFLLEPCVERVLERMPIWREAGIRRIVCGAIPHTPDANPPARPGRGAAELLAVLRGVHRHRDAARLRGGRPGDCDVHGGEPVFANGKAVGVTTSGAYGHYTGRSLGFAYVEPHLAAPGTTFAIDLLGEPRAATVLAKAVYGPTNERLRAQA